jgi:hypothetical protein
MFSGQIVWRGVIYAILMTIGKMITGLWLVRFSSNPVSRLVSIIKKPFSYLHSSCTERQKSKHPKKGKTSSRAKPEGNNKGNTQDNNSDQNESTDTPASQSPISLPPKPKSLYPPSILGLAMVARGEVGYLIASIAESQGIFSNKSSDGPSEAYLVVIWAISLCTLIGPIMVGTLVKRVKKLQKSRESQESDPLGIWGI